MVVNKYEEKIGCLWLLGLIPKTTGMSLTLFGFHKQKTKKTKVQKKLIQHLNKQTNQPKASKLTWSET